MQPLVGGGVLAVVVWLVASGLAWLLRLVEDVKADFLTDDGTAPETGREPSPSVPPVRRQHARRR